MKYGQDLDNSFKTKEDKASRSKTYDCNADIVPPNQLHVRKHPGEALVSGNVACFCIVSFWVIDVCFLVSATFTSPQVLDSEQRKEATMKRFDVLRRLFVVAEEGTSQRLDIFKKNVLKWLLRAVVGLELQV